MEPLKDNFLHFSNLIFESDGYGRGWAEGGGGGERGMLSMCLRYMIISYNTGCPKIRVPLTHAHNTKQFGAKVVNR